MFTNLNDNAKGILLGLISFGAFAISDATAKWLTGDYSTLQILGWNALFALGAILVLSPFFGGPKAVFKTGSLNIHLGRAICNVCISILVVIAFAKLSLDIIYTLLFISPFISTLLAIPIYREKVSPHGWAAIIAGFAGVLVVLRPGSEALNLWLFVPILSTLFIAGLWLLSRALPARENLLCLAIYPVLLNLALALPLSLILNGLPDPKDFILFALCGLMIITGLICGATAFRIAKTSVISPLHYTQILWGIMFGYMLFADVPDRWTLIGAAIIIGSGLYLIFMEGRAKKFGPDHI